ncbi:MAG: winged helix-turn-helix domain-containing protein, partial [Acidobacteria bacterium]|nr:winged helix-turn-helix domain-containing protein [Acidobacteriota bacterium]NIQ86982.1 winged helix-turn-helix domain-containing protein [Acidobacteriota bacterium]
WLLSLNGLAPPIPGDGLPVHTGLRGGAWVRGMVRRLGFVQVDPIAVVARAHDQILFARNPSYRPAHLKRALEQERSLFENWTHDAAILPVEHFPYWRHYMDRFKRWKVHAGYRRYFGQTTDRSVASVRRHVRRNGPTRPRDIESEKCDWGDADSPVPTVAKVTIEYLWRTGEMAVTARAGQEKVYDLASRVIPEECFARRVGKRDYVDWACRESLLRLGAATPAQIAHFFDAVSTKEAQAWCEGMSGRGLDTVNVELANRSNSRPVFALAGWEERLESVPRAPGKLRLLSPFDPLIHDRNRTERIFGFDYAVEIFVPPKKRKYGYYVLPLLEGERFVGRIDLKLDRNRSLLNVLGLWWERGVKATAQRKARLERQLERQARFAGVDQVVGF